MLQRLNVLLVLNIFLLFGSESMTAQVDSVRSDPSGGTTTRFIDLPFSASEISGIEKRISGSLFVEGKATESAFKENAGKFGILHIATHALIDDAHPMYSKFIFADGGSLDDDRGILNTYEVYNLKLNASMAVLSACNTGHGRMIRGEGIISLARGFMYAGCPSVIMTLWPVADRSTSEVMDVFYQRLISGLPKDEALRQAKLDYINQAEGKLASPYYWAGFISIGDQSPLKIISGERDKNSDPFKDLLTISLFVAVLSGVAAGQRLRRPGAKGTHQAPGQ